MTMTVKITMTDANTLGAKGKLADAELHFTDGPLDGLKLIGFAVWETNTPRRTVTFPARQYSINGERRSYALLRSVADTRASEPLKAAILVAYDEYVTSAQ